MNCEDARKRILDMDNDCDPARDPVLAGHVDSCDECRRFHGEIRRAWSALDRLPELDAAPDFNRTVWAKIEARERKAPLRLLSLAFLPPPLRAAAWAALAVVVATAGFVVFHATRQPPPMEQLTVTDADRQDEEMLMELDALINYDESQLLSTYQDWETTPEVRDRSPETPPAPKPADKQPDEKRINRIPTKQQGWINQA